MTRVFISYSRKDIEIVRQLAKDLEKADFDVWWDISDLKGGDAWARTIQAALEESEYCVLVLSPNSVESEWVTKECLFAIEQGIRIIPIFYKTCEVPLVLANIQYIDFRGDRYDHGLRELLTVLQAPPDTTMPDGELSQRSAEISGRVMAISFLLSFVSVVIIVGLFSQMFRCVLEYRMTEATVTLLAVLLSGAGVLFTRIAPPRVQKVLYCMYGGIASALLLSVLMVKFSPPPPQSDCLSVLPPTRDTSLFTPTSTSTLTLIAAVIPVSTSTPTDTSVPLTDTPVPPTDTPPVPLTDTPVPPTDTPPVPLTDTPIPPTDTLTPTDTPTAVEPLTGKIAFPVYQGDQRYIYLADLDGVEPTLKRLTRDASEPALSPDGSQIAFRSWNASTRGLIVMNVNGTYPCRVSRSLEDACPCWAQGESLVFHSTKEGPTPRLYTAGTWEGANGVNNVQDVRWGTDPVHGQCPAWVPGGRVVYKYFERSGNFRGLYVMNLNGANPTPITDHAGDKMPSVSPLGDRVAFMSDCSGHWEVHTVSINGSGRRQLTDSGGYNSGLPTWSPDGRYIAFVSDRENQWAIWVINSDGSSERKLFDLEGTLTWGERISWAP